jgi:hypothetical protein
MPKKLSTPRKPPYPLATSEPIKTGPKMKKR